jgi:membrane protein YdbS with pleckstrin-like domain
MGDRSYLHDGERLLLRMSPGFPALLRGIARAAAEAFVLGLLLGAVVIGSFWVAFDIALPWQLGALFFAILFVVLCWLRHGLWKRAAVRVTNDRILIQEPGPYSLKSLKTIKWSQYQESATKKGGVVDMLFGVKHLLVRYGTADAQRQAAFPCLPYATDIKHYLDKVDSAVRDGTVATVKAFVAKPRGKRDAA